MTARIVIVGAGFSGAVIARELAEAGIATWVVDVVHTLQEMRTRNVATMVSWCTCMGRIFFIRQTNMCGIT
jgi:glycine/D-amino acid oxidase-like deaminating enzyme